MASCLTIQTRCHYSHCGVDLWQNSYLVGIQPSSLQTFSKTLFICSVYVKFRNIITWQWLIQCKSVDGVFYDRDLQFELVKNCEKLKRGQREFSASSFRFQLFKLCKDIPKSLCFTFLNGVQLIRFTLQYWVAWTWSLWVTKIVLEWHEQSAYSPLSARGEGGWPSNQISPGGRLSLQQNFQKRGLSRTSTFREGLPGKSEVTFFRGGVAIFP